MSVAAIAARYRGRNLRLISRVGGRKGGWLHRRLIRQRKRPWHPSRLVKLAQRNGGSSGRESIRAKLKTRRHMHIHDSGFNICFTIIANSGPRSRLSFERAPRKHFGGSSASVLRPSGFLLFRYVCMQLCTYRIEDTWMHG